MNKIIISRTIYITPGGIFHLHLEEKRNRGQKNENENSKKFENSR
jgi:hypothetical protein